MNVKLLEEILLSDHEYWIMAQKTGNILMIVIPIGIKRLDEREDIKLLDLEKLERVELIGNYYFNPQYPPFQSGQTLCNVSNAYPILCDSRKFLLEASNLDVNCNLWDYKLLIDELIEDKKL